MSEFTSRAKIRLNDAETGLEIERKSMFLDLLTHLGNGRSVDIIIRYTDRRQDWIDKWYTYACRDERCKTITIKHCKDATFIMGMARCASAAPRHGDKYDKHTGIAVAYAKLCGEKIPEYI